MLQLLFYFLKPKHLPRTHQKYLERTPSRLIHWSETIGPNTAELVKKILDSRPHPEQGYHYHRAYRCGKNLLACALGNAACRKGYSTRYFRVPRLLTDLKMSKGDGTYSKLLHQLLKLDLLILDDWGLTPLSADEGREILEVIEDRNHLSSTIIVSQLPIEHWHEILGDPTVADAILDRLVHNAH
ncbi:ATPase AAA, partial [Calderihabitans maritimus]